MSLSVMVAASHRACFGAHCSPASPYRLQDYAMSAAYEPVRLCILKRYSCDPVVAGTSAAVIMMTYLSHCTQQGLGTVVLYAD